LEFRIQIDDDVPDYLILDETRFRQVLINLLGNAFKFTDQGKVELRVSSSLLQSRERELVISVEDNGIGIPEDQQEKIFEEFEQQKGQDPNQYGGTGLGLAITKKIVETMGGNITVSSTKSVGSTFKIVLKDVQIPLASDAVERSEVLFDPNSVTFEKATVLMAEDIPLNRELIKTYLNYPELQILEAENGEICIQIAKQKNPDLILMDMKMPVMDGFTASKQLKLDPDLNTIPIIVITASSLKEDKEIITQSCEGYLRKPVSREELVQEMTKYLPCSIESASEQPVNESEKEPSFSSKNFNKETMTKLQELMKILEKNILPQWERRDALSINNTQSLAEQAMQLGSSFHYLPLQQWGEQLNTSIEMFDIENVEKQMDGFSFIVTQLKEILLSNAS